MLISIKCTLNKRSFLQQMINNLVLSCYLILQVVLNHVHLCLNETFMPACKQLALFSSSSQRKEQASCGWNSSELFKDVHQQIMPQLIQNGSDSGWK